MDSKDIQELALIDLGKRLAENLGDRVRRGEDNTCALIEFTEISAGGRRDMQRNMTGSCFGYSELFVTHQRKDIWIQLDPCVSAA